MTTPLPLDAHSQPQRRRKTLRQQTDQNLLCGSITYPPGGRHKILAALLHATNNSSIRMRRFTLVENDEGGHCHYVLDGDEEARALFSAALTAGD